MSVHRLLVICLILVAVGCATAPEEPEPDPVVIAEPTPDPQPQPDPEPEPTPEPEPLPEPEPEPEPDPVVEGPIEVSEDLYEQAFGEVEEVIEELNFIISRRQFDRWTTYLTDEYVEYYSSEQVLEELSRNAILAQNNIRLRTLRDYFLNVVVPSRASARLDDLIFYTDTLVEAVTIFRGQSVILYELRKIDGEWKIDTLQTLPSEESSEASSETDG